MKLVYRMTLLPNKKDKNKNSKRIIIILNNKNRTVINRTVINKTRNYLLLINNSKILKQIQLKKNVKINRIRILHVD